MTLTLILLSMIPALVWAMYLLLDTRLGDTAMLWRVPQHIGRNCVVMLTLLSQLVMPLHYGGILQAMPSWIANLPLPDLATIVHGADRYASEERPTAWEVLLETHDGLQTQPTANTIANDELLPNESSALTHHNALEADVAQQAVASVDDFFVRPLNEDSGGFTVQFPAALKLARPDSQSVNETFFDGDVVSTVTAGAIWNSVHHPNPTCTRYWGTSTSTLAHWLARYVHGYIHVKWMTCLSTEIAGGGNTSTAALARMKDAVVTDTAALQNAIPVGFIAKADMDFAPTMPQSGIAIRLTPYHTSIPGTGANPFVRLSDAHEEPLCYVYTGNMELAQDICESLGVRYDSGVGSPVIDYIDLINQAGQPQVSQPQQIQISIYPLGTCEYIDVPPLGVAPANGDSEDCSAIVGKGAVIKDIIYYGIPTINEDALAGHSQCGNSCVQSNTAIQTQTEVDADNGNSSRFGNLGHAEFRDSKLASDMSMSMSPFSGTGDIGSSNPLIGNYTRTEEDIHVSAHGHTLNFTRNYSTRRYDWNCLRQNTPSPDCAWFPMGGQWTHNYNVFLQLNLDPGTAATGTFYAGNGSAHAFRRIITGGSPYTPPATCGIIPEPGAPPPPVPVGLCIESSDTVVTYKLEFDNGFLADIFVCDVPNYESGCSQSYSTKPYGPGYYFEVVLHDETRFVMLAPPDPTTPGAPYPIARPVLEYRSGNEIPIFYQYGGLGPIGRLESVTIGEPHIQGQVATPAQGARGLRFDYVNYSIVTPIDNSPNETRYASLLSEVSYYQLSNSPAVEFHYFSYVDDQPDPTCDQIPQNLTQYRQAGTMEAPTTGAFATPPELGFRLFITNDIHDDSVGGHRYWCYQYENAHYERVRTGGSDAIANNMTPYGFMTHVVNPLGNVIEQQDYYSLNEMNSSETDDITPIDLYKLQSQKNGLNVVTTQFDYDPEPNRHGGVTSIVTDANDVVRKYYYTASGTLREVTVIEDDGTEITMSARDHDEAQLRATSVWDGESVGRPAPIAMQWSDDGERLETLTNTATGLETRYTYNNSHAKSTGDLYNVPSSSVTEVSHPLFDNPDITLDVERTTSFTYDQQFPILPSTITNAAGQLTAFEYYTSNNIGKLKAVTAPNGIRTTHTYDANGQLFESVYNDVTSPSQHDHDIITRNTYDDMGRLESSCQFPNDTDYRRCQYMEYDDAGNTTYVVQNAAYNANTEIYTPTVATSDQNLSTRMYYDDAGRLYRVVDATGRETWMYYNGADQLIHTVINCIGCSINSHTSHNPNNPDQNINIRYGYDRVGNRLFVKYEYDSVGTGRIDGTCYDNWNRPIRTVQNFTEDGGVDTGCAPNYSGNGSLDANIVTDYAYDLSSNLVSVTYPPINNVRRVDHYCYDLANRLVRTVQNSTATGHSAACDLMRSDNPGNEDTNIITDYEYDEAGNITQVHDPEGLRTLYLYDTLDRPYAIIRNYTGFDFHAVTGRNVSPNKDYNITQLIYYDNVGNVKATLAPNGQVTWMCYDAMNRVTKQITNVSVPNHTLGLTRPDFRGSSWDAITDHMPFTSSFDGPTNNNNPCADNYVARDNSASDQDIITSYAYDNLGRMVSVSTPLTDNDTNRITHFKYDMLDRVTQRIDSYEDGNPDSVTDVDVIYIYEYNIEGTLQQTKENVVNGSATRTHTFEYDRLDRPTRQITTTNSSEAIEVSISYRSNGTIDRQIDANGNVATFEYDELYRLTESKDALNHVTSYTYDPLGNLQTVRDPMGNGIDYQYDGLYRRESSTVAGLGYTTSFTYDSMSRVKTITDAEGVMTVYDYDRVGRLLSVQENVTPPQATCATISSTNTDANVCTEYAYDTMGNVFLIRMPTIDNRIILFRYDQMNRRVRTEATGFADDWIITYDKGGRPVTITNPLHADADSDSYTAKMTYDRMNRLTSVDYADLGTPDVSYTYDVFGMRKSMTTAGVGTTQYRYDDLSRLTCVSDARQGQASKQVVTYKYYDGGQREQMWMAGNTLTDCDSITHHAPGNADYRSIRYNYDGANRLEQVTGWDSQLTDYGYDAANRLTGITLPNNVEAKMTYDRDNTLNTLTYENAVQPLMTYDYDVNKVGYRTQVTEKLYRQPVCDGNATYVSTVSDLRSEIAQADGTEVICLDTDGFYEFTAAQGSTANALPAIPANANVTIIGNGATLRRGETPTEFRFFEVPAQTLLTLQDITLDGGSVNGDGGAIHNSGRVNLVDVTLQSNTATRQGGAIYSYSGEVVGSNVVVRDNEADAGGGIYMAGGGFRLSDSLITANVADEGGGGYFDDVNGEVTHINLVNNESVTGDGGGFAIYESGMQATANLPQPAILATHTIGYEYDGLYRLTDAKYYEGTVETSQTTADPYLAYEYAYDLWSNRTSEVVRTDGNIVSEKYFGYNIANQLETINLGPENNPFETWEYTYDANGNVDLMSRFAVGETTPSRTDDLEWDHANRLKRYSVSTADPTEGDYSYSYTYNGDGDRLSQSYTDNTNTTTTNYLLDSSSGLTQVLGEFSETEETYYLLGLDVIGGETSAGTASRWNYFHADGLGSNRMVTDTSSWVTQTANYDPYGKPLQTNISSTSFGFTGEQTDNTGVQYLRARYYNPATGTFLSKDPVLGAMGMSATYNGYSYVNGNPVNLTDPSGEFVWSLLFGAGAGAAIGGGTEIISQLAAGVHPDCINWDSVADAALQGAILGAISGATGGLLAMSGASPATAFLVAEGVDFLAGVALDVSMNDMSMRDAVVTNAIGAGIGGVLGVAGGELAGGFRRADLTDDLSRAGRRADVGDDVSRSARRANRDAGIGSVCPANSFSADTPVSTPDGDIPISEVEIGDTVYAYSEETGEVGEYEVTHTWVHDDDTIVTLTIDGEIVETTPWHPFYTDEGWEDAGDLEVGDLVLSLDGDYGLVDAVLVEDRTETMYDLTVDVVHTFAIGDGEWVVHNCGGTSGSKTPASPSSGTTSSANPTPDIVYRNPSQRRVEHPDAYELGFQPKDPSKTYKVAYHISHGNVRDTQYISTTRNLDIALEYQVPGTPTYIIDLNKVPGTVYDFTDPTVASTHLKSARTRNLAVRVEEVTVEGAIPPDAIIGTIEVFD